MQKTYENQKLEKERRLYQKNFEFTLKEIINTGTNCSPIESEIIVEKSKEIFGIGEYSLFKEMKSGQFVFEAVAIDQPAGRPLEKCKRVKIILTLISFKEDLEVYKSAGSAAKRRQQILRITCEAKEQGGLLTQEDLSLILDTDVRTIRSDIKYLKDKGIIAPTRGTYQDIGPGVTHKQKVIELFIEGKEALDIARGLNHSLTAVERYIHTFCRVVYCQRQFRNMLKTAMVIGISVPLANTYWDLHNKYLEVEPYQELLKNIEETGKSYYDTVDWKKKSGPKKNSHIRRPGQ